MGRVPACPFHIHALMPPTASNATAGATYHALLRGLAGAPDVTPSPVLTASCVAATPAPAGAMPDPLLLSAGSVPVLSRSECTGGVADSKRLACGGMLRRPRTRKMRSMLAWPCALENGTSASASSATSGEAIFAIGREATRDHRIELGRDAEPEAGQRLAVVAEDLGDDLRHRVAVEWARVADELVEDDAHRPDVGALVDVLGVGELLGRHVERRAHGRGRLGERDAIVFELGDAEIEDLDHDAAIGLVREEQVAGLQVAVNDALGVRFGQGFQRFDDVVDGFGHRQCAVRLEHLLEVEAFEVLHDHERAAVRESPHVQHAHDVLALHARGGAGLTREALDDLRVLGGFREEKLDGNALIEMDVRGGHHEAHAALSEHALDAVLVRENLALNRELPSCHN